MTTQRGDENGGANDHAIDDNINDNNSNGGGSGSSNSNNSNNGPILAPPDPNKIWCFFAETNDEEMVRNTTYSFNLPVETLINNSDDTRLAQKNRKNGTNQVPRPQNAWIIYRRDKSSSHEFKGLKSSVISKEVGKLWNNEPPEIKKLFGALERISNKIHDRKYKNYKYKPRPPKTPKTSKTKRNKGKETTDAGPTLKLHPHVFPTFEVQQTKCNEELVTAITERNKVHCPQEEAETTNTDGFTTKRLHSPIAFQSQNTLGPAVNAFPQTIMTPPEESNTLGLITPTTPELSTEYLELMATFATSNLLTFEQSSELAFPTSITNFNSGPSNFMESNALGLMIPTPSASNSHSPQDPFIFTPDNPSELISKTSTPATCSPQEFSEFVEFPTPISISSDDFMTLPTPTTSNLHSPLIGQQIFPSPITPTFLEFEENMIISPFLDLEETEPVGSPRANDTYEDWLLYPDNRREIFPQFPDYNSY